jgi:hypothetical protein
VVCWGGGVAGSEGLRAEGVGGAAEAVDCGADVRLAQPVPSAGGGSGADGREQQCVGLCGDDPCDGAPPHTLTPLFGQALRMCESISGGVGATPCYSRTSDTVSEV